MRTGATVGKRHGDRDEHELAPAGQPRAQGIRYLPRGLEGPKPSHRDAGQDSKMRLPERCSANKLS